MVSTARLAGYHEQVASMQNLLKKNTSYKIPGTTKSFDN